MHLHARAHVARTFFLRVRRRNARLPHPPRLSEMAKPVEVPSQDRLSWVHVMDPDDVPIEIEQDSLLFFVD